MSKPPEVGCSVSKSCPTLCDSMDCSIPGFPVLHCVLEFAQTHVHQVGDAIQPSHPLSTPSPPAFSLSQQQGLFQWVSSLHQVTKLLEFLHQSFQWVFRVDFLWDWLVWSPWSPRDSQESSLAPQLESRHFQISCRQRLNRGEDPSQAEAWGLLGKGSPQMSSVCLGHKCE